MVLRLQDSSLKPEVSNCAVTELTPSRAGVSAKTRARAKEKAVADLPAADKCFRCKMATSSGHLYEDPLESFVFSPRPPCYGLHTDVVFVSL